MHRSRRSTVFTLAPSASIHCKRAQRALALCERAYACDPSHTGAKRRLSGWAPEKWKERIAKEVSLRDLHDTPLLLLFKVYQKRCSAAMCIPGVSIIELASSRALSADTRKPAVVDRFTVLQGDEC